MKKLIHGSRQSNQKVGKVKGSGNLVRSTLVAGTVLVAGIMACCDKTEKAVPAPGYSEMSRTVNEKMVATAAPESAEQDEALERLRETKTHTVKKGDTLAVGGIESEVVKVDDKGIELDNGSRLNYGEKRKTGEFALTDEFQVEKGEQPGTAKVIVTKAVPIKAEQAADQLKVGQELSFGVTWRAMYSIKVTGISKDTITADVTMPFGTPTPTVNIISVNLRFNDVKIPKKMIKPLVNAIQGKMDKTKEMLAETEKMVLDDLKPEEKASMESDLRKLAKKVEKSVQRQDEQEENIFSTFLSDDVEELSMRLSDNDELGRLLAQVLGMGEDWSLEAEEKVDFVVESSNERELVLKVKGGKYDGKTLKLDRKMDWNIEFLFEKAGFVTLPLRIESLSVDEKGKVRAKVGPDCSRDVYLEIFESEYATGKYPACEKQ